MNARFDEGMAYATCIRIFYSPGYFRIFSPMGVAPAVELFLYDYEMERTAPLLSPADTSTEI